MVSLEDVRTALDRRKARTVPIEEGTGRAGVAAVVRGVADGVEALFIHRAEHPDDPWSGHMAFPGGRMDPGDADPLAAAVRETREELALDLEQHGRLMGRLSDVPAVGRGRPLPLVIEPYVFELFGEPALVPNHEVEAVVWVPIAFLLDRSNRSTVGWRHGGMTIPLPCYEFEGHVIWGLTFGMVDELVGLLEGGEPGPRAWT